MEAVKFLHPGRVAPFTRVTWPRPGEWLISAEPPELCSAGVHALLADVLAVWIAEELWRVELDGGQELAPGIVVAPRGRLLGRVEAWNDPTARQFARACAAHVGGGASGRAAEYAADATAAAEQARADDSSAKAAYMAAHAAEAMAPGSFAAERRWQSWWLANRLGVRTG